MAILIDAINEIQIPISGKELQNAFNELYRLSSIDLTEEEKILLRYDLDFFYEKGRWVILQTFAGGIIFLREPETINKIEIQFHSNQNEALALVVYGSKKRNARNIKYKPGTGQIENLTWNMLGIFPN